MPLPIDASRSFLRPSDLRELVDAVVAHGHATDEHDWIEWKRRLDLTDVRTHWHIAKHVLGFANRSVATAQRHAQGHSYLIIGAEPGSVTGVEPIDPADLVNALARFLGSDGPSWSPESIAIGKEIVLIIIVEPPQDGDPIHTSHLSIDKHQAGTVFIRQPGRTQQASHADVRMLTARAMAVQERIKIGVRVSRPVEQSAPDLADQLAEALSSERTFLVTGQVLGGVAA